MSRITFADVRLGVLHHTLLERRQAVMVEQAQLRSMNNSKNEPIPNLVLRNGRGRLQSLLKVLLGGLLLGKLMRC